MSRGPSSCCGPSGLARKFYLAVDGKDGLRVLSNGFGVTEIVRLHLKASRKAMLRDMLALMPPP
jgi:hypothetical protein